MKLLGRIHQDAELLISERERRHDGASRHVDLEGGSAQPLALVLRLPQQALHPLT
jgi:hypothetical protein